MAVLTPAFTTPKATGLELAIHMKLLSHYTRGMTRAYCTIAREVTPEQGHSRVSVYYLCICKLIGPDGRHYGLTHMWAQSLSQLSFTILLRYRSVHQLLPLKMVLQCSGSFSCTALLAVVRPAVQPIEL